MSDPVGQACAQLEDARRRVLAELDAYKYECPIGMIGNAWGAEKIEGQLRALRAALVSPPYWANISRRDTIEHDTMPNQPVSRGIVVADDGRGTLLVFDPGSDHFLLAKMFRGAIESFGVSGDAVGCFMAR